MHDDTIAESQAVASRAGFKVRFRRNFVSVASLLAVTIFSFLHVQMYVEIMKVKSSNLEEMSFDLYCARATVSVA